jgi:methylase of polypeptide subunit release factors
MAAETYPETLPRARRRALGAFYTPGWIVDAVVDEALAGPLARARWSRGAPALRVLDPACGDGRFLAACLERMAARPGARRAEIVHRCLVGIERDPEAAARARAALGPGADVRVAEALTSGAAAPGAWDVVVGNPPWIRSVALKAADPSLWRRLRGAYAATSYREWDLYGAFLEQALDWLAPGGELGLVTPSRWLTAAFAARLRAKLAGHVRRVVDLGARQVFDGATTYTALVFARRARVEALELVRDGEPLVVPAGTWTVGPRLRGVPLGQLARIAKGAGTNADPVFLLEPRGPDRLWSHALGAEVAIEPSVLVPCLRGRDVAPWRASVGRVALLPYAGDRLLPLEELPPGARAYLERCRPRLEAREGGRFRGPRFHAWGRPQNLAWLRDPTPKIVVPDAAAAGRAALDSGTLVIDTAYAVRPLGATPPGLLLAVLNHPIVATWLRAHGIPLRGGYFRMKTAYLAGLPVPDPQGGAARRVADLALAGAHDAARDILSQAYAEQS